MWEVQKYQSNRSHRALVLVLNKNQVESERPSNLLIALQLTVIQMKLKEIVFF